MRSAGIAGRVRRRFRITTDSSHGRPVAPNVLDRRFGQRTPDSAWCADITYVRTESGWAYLAVVLDVATRLIVGWSMATHMRTELVEAALTNALVPAENAVCVPKTRSAAASIRHGERLDDLRAHLPRVSTTGSVYATREYR